MPGSKAAREAPVLKGMVEMKSGIVAIVIVPYPRSVVVHMRCFRMTRLIPEVLPRRLMFVAPLWFRCLALLRHLRLALLWRRRLTLFATAGLWRRTTRRYVPTAHFRSRPLLVRLPSLLMFLTPSLLSDSHKRGQGKCCS